MSALPSDCRSKRVDCIKMQHGRHLALNLSLVGIVLEFTLSGRIMAAIGVPYSNDGGPLIAKLHPGTYISACAVMARLATGLTPLTEAWRLIWRERKLAFYLCATLFCILYETLFTGAGGITLLVDVFLPAGLVGVALADITPSQATYLTRILQYLFMLNAIIALAEATIGGHLVPVADASEPLVVDSALQFGAEFRPTALYDHPLTGGTATLLGLLLYPDRRSMPLCCAAYTLCMFIALLAFGGRIAIALAMCAGAWLYARHVARRALLGRLLPVDLAPLLTLGALALPVAGFALTSGLASRLLAHLYWDASAQTRLAEFHLLHLLRTEQILFGCRRDDMIALLTPMQLAYGVDAIENFWLVMFVFLGALGFPAFVLGIASLFRWLWDRADGNTRVMLLCFVIVTSSSNSLGHKSPLLVMLVAAVMARTHTAPRGQTCEPVLGVEFPVTSART